MKPKQSEREWVQLCNRHQIWTEKLPDRQQCPKCRHLVEKPNKSVDYVAIVGKFGTLVEVKQGQKQGDYFVYGDSLSDIQRSTLTAFEKNHGISWLFLVLGVRHPNRGAWLIPWHNWRGIESKLRSYPLKSLSYKRAQVEIPRNYQVTWEAGGWILPNDHIFWKVYQGHFHLRIKQ